MPMNSILSAVLSLLIVVACGPRRHEPGAPIADDPILSSKQVPSSNVPVVLSEDAMPGIGSLPAGTSTPKTTVPVAPAVEVQSSCSAGSFSLKINQMSGGSSSITMSAFNGCTQIAEKLNAKKFPSGLEQATVSGGATVTATCTVTNLTLSVSQSNFMVDLVESYQSAACQEIANTINELKL